MRKGGFTYVEVFIVVALIGILLAIAGVSFGVFEKTKDYKALDDEIRIICKTMIETRNRTIMDGRKRQVLIGNECIYFQTIFKGQIQTEKISYHENLRLVTNTYSGQKLVFNPEGTVSSGGSITFQNRSGQKKTIVIQIGTGRIYWKEG